MAVEGLLLTPGAGGSSDHHVLVAIEAAVDPLPVIRMDFPYRLAGRRAPDRAPVLIEAILAELDRACRSWSTEPDRVVLGGRSMGGRMCSLAVAQGCPAAGLVLLSYPLHPPGRPDRLRTEHLGDVRVPVLMVAGRRDPFGSPEELEAASKLISGPVRHHWVDGGHDPKASLDGEIAAVVAAWVRSL